MTPAAQTREQLAIKAERPAFPAKFTPNWCDEQVQVLKLQSGTDSLLKWVAVVETPAPFPIEYFSPALLELLLHPERNTSLILRSEVLFDGLPPGAPKILFRVPDMEPVRNMTRRIVPRMPQRDRGIDQDCTFLVDKRLDADGANCIRLVVLSPRMEVNPGDGKESPLPWYHPPVRHLAFRYVIKENGEAVLRIEIIPLDPALQIDATSRLYRTCLGLLETVFKYGKGKMMGYKKRVIHDTLVPREEYQDLYLTMREKFKNIADVWHEVTDASKHVFEDISIATFLMLLWKYTYAAPCSASQESPNLSEPWHSWGRPPEGFLDLGCGNGLLVHILIECGYPGLGVDLRARKSWPHYPPSTRGRLFVHAFDPTVSCLHLPIPINNNQNLISLEGDMFPQTKSGKGRFIIGNHADEMQPWIPLLASLTNAEYLSIPCCAWDFDTRFQMKKKGRKELGDNEGQGDDDGPEAGTPEEVELERKLRYDEKDGKMSLYAAYVLWLAKLSEECGFVIESEALRIPSTRNRAIIGRKRQENSDDNAIKVRLRIKVEEIRARGLFRTRTPEGYAALEIENPNGGRSKHSVDRIDSLKHGEMNSDMPIMEKFQPTSLTWGSTSNAAPGFDVGLRPPMVLKSSQPKRTSRLNISFSAD